MKLALYQNIVAFHYRRFGYRRGGGGGGATDSSFVSQFRSLQVLKRDKIIRVELIVNCRVFARYRVQVI